MEKGKDSGERARWEEMQNEENVLVEKNKKERWGVSPEVWHWFILSANICWAPTAQGSTERKADKTPCC